MALERLDSSQMPGVLRELSADEQRAIHEEPEPVAEPEPAEPELLPELLREPVPELDPVAESIALQEPDPAVTREAADESSARGAVETALGLLAGAGAADRDDPSVWLERADDVVAREAADDPEAAAGARALRVHAHLVRGELDQVDAEIEAEARLASKLGTATASWWCALHRAMRAISRGAVDSGLELALEAAALGEEAGERNAEAWLRMMRLEVLLQRGDDIAPHIPALLDDVTDSRVEKHMADTRTHIALASLYAATGSRAEAREHFEHAFSGELGRRDDPGWAFDVARLAAVCVWLRDKSRAERLFDLLEPYRDRQLVAGIGAVYKGSVPFELGRLATLLRRFPEAEEHFLTAIDRETRAGARPYLASARLEYARMLLARSEPQDGERALEELGAALEIARELGMRGLVDEALHRREGLESASEEGSSIERVARAVARSRPDLASHSARDGSVTLLLGGLVDLPPGAAPSAGASDERARDPRAPDELGRHAARVRESCVAEGGFELALCDDAFCLVFPSARAAVLCAGAIQRRSAQASSAPGLHIGLHTGEVLADRDQFFNHTLWLTARICGQAEEGEILVSRQLKRLVEVRGDLHFDSGRRAELEGFPGQRELFALEWSEIERGTG
jgi:tetratricopeptide (TPR) repeat protein